MHGWSKLNVHAHWRSCWSAVATVDLLCAQPCTKYMTQSTQAAEQGTCQHNIGATDSSACSYHSLARHVQVYLKCVQLHVVVP